MKVLLTPIDTWFFRDSTPFDKGESPQAGVHSVFPPYPSTVAGAIRAALARSNGWNGRDRWSRELKEVLGDGPNDLGRLSIKGPFVVRHGVPLFPMPRHLVGRTDEGCWTPKGILRPGAARVTCDLGPSMRLPEVVAVEDDARELGPGSRQWVTLAGLQRIVRSEFPRKEEIMREDCVWVEEPRVGIARQLSSRTVAEGALYSTRHVRLQPGVSLAADVTGIPEDWDLPIGSLFPFGGENRLAACDTWEAYVGLESDESLGESGCIAFIVLTPALLGQEVVSGHSELFSEVGARVVCASVDRPLRIGGWNSLRRTPLPLKNALAPGSTLFCEVEKPARFRRGVTRGLVHVGHATAAGFGLCAVATAPVWEKTT
jgi:CRISPR-associated protein Cmr3